ncbi:monooxygenase [Tylopilus felleus]
MTYSSVSSEPTRAIIVGAGVAGLGCAIECKRKGHDVVVLEKVGTFKVLGHPALIHDVLLRHAVSLGLDVRMGREVVDYWEDDQNKTDGVILRWEENIEADLVVAADSVKNRARKYVLAQNRLGKDVHFLASSSCGGKSLSWVITHRDTDYVEGDWSAPGRIEDVLEIVKGWDPRCAVAISKAPSCWINKDGRVSLIGDAAHPFLPSSMQGTSQAIEDDITLAVALQMAGKDKVPLAARACERVGETTRDTWHRAEIGDKSAEELGLPMPE